ncbi:hypothetical protein K456DRAFT_1923340 [Colletotrichum gloeosporioides 23]|nr:hypothetical protein K456DRAFT_1923340 [Colletotrichum gloeosporioides 23]
MLFRNKSKFLEALDKEVSPNLSEVDAFGFSSLYHLIGWPEGLRIVLSRYGKSILHSHDKGVVASALECALQWSFAVCSNRWSGRCSETCPCGESASILLQTDSECLARTIQRESWNYAIQYASVRAREMVIDELACRRQELMALELHHLKPTEIDCFGLLGNSILDRHTSDVLKALDKKGICIHPSLRTEAVDEESHTSGSIYHHDGIGSHMDFMIPDAFYSRGFTEVDVPNPHGLVPLASMRNTLRYRMWLVEHGASLTTGIPGRPVGFTTAHMLFCPEVPSWTFSPSFRYNSISFKPLGSHISKSASLDACKCGCSKDGCHPYTVMWRVALGDWSVDQITQASLGLTGDQIMKLCEHPEKDWTLSRDEMSILLRVCTFMALPIRHTCCCSWEHKFDQMRGHHFEWAYSDCEEDEVEQIREEDSHELALLENLLVEFESKIDDMGCPLATFFQTYWIDRMGQVLQEIQERTLLEEEIRGNIGHNIES